MNRPRILIAVTSHDRLGSEGDPPTGVWIEELAVPWLRFADAGAHIMLASPRGGVVPIDPKSVKPVGQNHALVERFLADEDAQRQCSAAVALSVLDMRDFDAVFFPGGHGTMWDLPVNSDVRRLVEQASNAGKVVAAVCHGPAALVGARLPDGRPLVSGRRVAAFTDTEEAAAGLTDVVPFLLEARLRALGAQFERVADWQPFAVRDGRLITGQNPASSQAVADHVLAAIAS
jgi:putative intracellular protease/amidase